MNELARRHCTPLPAGTPPLGSAQVDAFLKEVPGWTRARDAIEKSWSFADFYETMAFVNAVAWIAHAQDHHPDIALSYNRCSVSFSTHSVGGISENDFICAAKIEALCG
jgi:4a-hydroxytetrahydrobiopterin dehydratase